VVTRFNKRRKIYQSPVLIAILIFTRLLPSSNKTGLLTGTGVS